MPSWRRMGGGSKRKGRMRRACGSSCPEPRLAPWNTGPSMLHPSPDVLPNLATMRRPNLHTLTITLLSSQPLLPSCTHFPGPMQLDRPSAAATGAPTSPRTSALLGAMDRARRANRPLLLCVLDTVRCQPTAGAWGDGRVHVLAGIVRAASCLGLQYCQER